MQRYAKNRTELSNANPEHLSRRRRLVASVLSSLGNITAALIAFAALAASARPALAQSQLVFGTGTDIWWAQTNGNPTAAPALANSSDPTGFSVDGLWDDTLSTGYGSPNNVPAGSYPSINWSTNAAGAGATGFTPAPGPYPSGSPNPDDPGYIPGSPGHTNVDVVFDATDGDNSPTDVRINYSPTIQGLMIDNPGNAVSLTADNVTESSAPETITLGSDGITMTSVAGTSPTVVTAGTQYFTLGPTFVSPNTYGVLSVNLSASQTWADYTHTTDTSGTTSVTSNMLAWAVTSPLSVAPGVTGITTLTFTTGGNLSSSVNNHINGDITDGTNGQLALVFNSGLWTFGPGSTTAAPVGVSSFTGGIVVQSGAQLRDTYPTGAGTGTVVVQSGGAFVPSYFDNSGSSGVGSPGVSVVANPIFITGSGNAGTSGANNFTVGALDTMNTNGANITGETVTLTGGVTLGGSSLVEAITAPMLINTNPVSLGSNPATVLTLVSNYSTTTGAPKMSDTIEVDSPIQGAGSVTINNTVEDLGSPATQYYGQTVLAGANTYAGATVINNGIVQIGNGGTNGSFGGGAITFNYPTAGKSFGLLAFDLTSNYTINNAISFAGPTTIVQGGTFESPPSTGASLLTSLPNAGTTVLNSVTAFSGSTVQPISMIVQSGTLELNSYPFGPNSPSGLSVTLNSNISSSAPLFATIAFGPNYFSNDPNPSSTTPLNNYVLPFISTSSQGTLALSVNSSESLDFSLTGFNFQALGLGAVGNVTYTGSFTPSNQGYIFGGGGGTLNFSPSNGVTTAAASSIAQNGAGTTILGGTITFNGSTQVNAGNLEFNAYDSSLPTGSITVNAGAVAVGPTWISQFLAANPGNTTPITSSFLGAINTGSIGALALTGDTSENLDFSSNDPYGGFSNLSLGAIGTVNYTGTLTPNGTTYFLGGGGGTLNFHSTLVDQGSPTSLVVANSGTVVLTNSNSTYSGGTIISSGTTLQIDSDTASSGLGSMSELGQAPASPAINITLGGGTLRISNSTTLNANRAISLGVSGTPSGTIDVMPGAVVNYAGTILDGLGGSAALTVTDSGELVLTGVNTYSGGTTIQNGATVQLDMGVGQLGTAGITLTGGTLALTSSNSTTTLPNNNSISATNPANVSGETSGIFLTGINSGTISGPVTVMNSTLLVTGDTGPYTLTLGSTLTVGGGAATVQVNNNGSNTGNLIVQGPLIASGAPQITFTGGGTITLQSPTTALPINTQITVGPNTTLNSDNATALWQFAQVSVGSGATLNLGAAQTVSSLSGTGLVNLNGNTLTIGNIDAATGTFSGILADNGTMSAVVVANGSATLTGANSYSGGTTMTGGTLRIGNSAGSTPLGSGSLQISGGSLALIGGSGTSQTYATNVAVSGNTSVNVSGALTAQLGDLSIGTNLLTVGSSDTSSNPYSLTFSGNTGVTTLTGSPAFIVNKSSGAQMGTLNLGALNDGGTARTISFGGTGRTVLGSAATSLVAGTQVNVLNATSGTVVKNTSNVAVNPISDYTFSAASGSVVTDSGSLGYNGQFVGTGISYSPNSKIGLSALSLTHSNSYVQIPSYGGGQELTSTSTTPTSYTISAWVNASTLNANSTVFSTRNGGGHSFDLQINSSGLSSNVGNGTIWESPGNGVGGFVLSDPISTNTWYLVTATVTSTATTLYINDGNSADGGATQTFTYTAMSPVLETDSEFATIGNQFDGVANIPSGYQFLGQISDVRLYNSALTAAEVAQLYDVSPAGATLDSNNATAIGNSSALTLELNSTFSLGASQQVQTLSGTGTVALGANTLTVGTGTGDSSTSTFSGTFTGTTGGLTISKSSTGSLTIASSNTLTGPVAVNSGSLRISGSSTTVSLNGGFTLGSGASVAAASGTLVFNSSVGSSISATNGGISVSPGATVQLTGGASALSDATTPTQLVNVANNGTLQSIGTTTQTTGAVTGTSSTSNGATVYGGSTIAGDGTNTSTLTAAQVLQSSIAVNPSATLVLAPASTTMMDVATSSGSASGSTASAAASSDSAAGGSAGSSDPLSIIESAMASGEISSSTGEIYENEIAAIDRLAATNPQVNVSLLDSAVLNSLARVEDSSDASLGESGSSMLTIDGSSDGSSTGSSLGSQLSSGGAVGGSAAAVPEPSTILLTALGALGIGIALRRRRIQA